MLPPNDLGGLPAQMSAASTLTLETMVEHTIETKTPSQSPLSQLAAERTAALVVAALGAGLLVAAAGTFIVVSCDRLGLETTKPRLSSWRVPRSR